MSEIPSNNEHTEAKIYQFPEQTSPDQLETELDIEITDKAEQVDFIYSHWLHPSLKASNLAEVIAARRLDNTQSEQSNAWSDCIASLIDNSPLDDNYEQIINDENQTTLQALELFMLNTKPQAKDYKPERQAVLVLMDLLAYEIQSGSDQRTLKVYQKMTQF